MQQYLFKWYNARINKDAYRLFWFESRTDAETYRNWVNKETKYTVILSDSTELPYRKA